MYRKIIVIGFLFLIVLNGLFATEEETPASSVQEDRDERTTAMNPDKLNFGISINPGGLLGYGFSVCLEFTKGNFNTEINVIRPSGMLLAKSVTPGFGGLLTFNYFQHSRIGGFYAGGGLGYIEHVEWYAPPDMHFHGYHVHTFTFGLNLGYKFVTRSGIYFRTGGYLGMGLDMGSSDFGSSDFLSVYYKPDLAIGLTTTGRITSSEKEEWHERTTAMSPDKLNFGFSINPGGLLGYGSSLCFEFTKGNLNTEINVILPFGFTGLLTRMIHPGFGGLLTFNYFRPSRLGGVYAGGGLGYIWHQEWYLVDDYNPDSYDDFDVHVFTFGLNIGYKFVTRSGIYFRTGGYLGMGLNFGSPYGIVSGYIKPDLAIGWTMK